MPELTEIQRYELQFWKEKWPYRDWSIPELQKLRHADASWLLTNLGFQKRGEHAFDGFEGDVLEVGCGPMGFFELVQGVKVTAIDCLMNHYSAEIRYSTLGTRGASTYEARRLEDEQPRYRFVVCSNLLDSSDDWMDCLENHVRRVAPGGELLLSSDTRSRPMLGHTQVFTPAQVERALRWLRAAEFRTMRAERSPHDLTDYRLFVRAAF